MNIGFYNPNYSLPVPAVGGGAVEELEEILINQNENNSTYNFVMFQPLPTKEQMEKLSTYSYKNTKLVFIKENKFVDLILRVFNKFFKFLHLKKRFCLSYDRNFYKLLKKHNVDRLVFEGSYPTFNIERVEKLIGRNNLYFHFHSDYTKDIKIVNNVGGLISVSQFISNKWSDFIKEKNFEKNVNLYVLKNCVNDDKFSKRIDEQTRKDIRTSLGFCDEDFVVIFCGRILKIKGVKELMQAVCELENKNIKLLIIGSPNFSRIEKSQYLEDVKNLTNNNPQKIVFSGYIENRNLYKYYQSADLQVVPSTYNDPAPLVVLEGLKSALPQICTISGGIPEYVENGTILIDRQKDLVKNLKENILKLYEDKDLCAKMSKINKEQGKLFTCENFYKDFVEIMEKNNG